MHSKAHDIMSTQRTQNSIYQLTSLLVPTPARIETEGCTRWCAGFMVSPLIKKTKTINKSLNNIKYPEWMLWIDIK